MIFVLPRALAILRVRTTLNLSYSVRPALLRSAMKMRDLSCSEPWGNRARLAPSVMRRLSCRRRSLAATWRPHRGFLRRGRLWRVRVSRPAPPGSAETAPHSGGGVLWRRWRATVDEDGHYSFAVAL